MKNLTIIFLLLFAMSSFTGNSQNQLKRYDLQSGEIIYETATSGKMMGSTISGSGTEKLYFKDWGAVELRETETTETTVVKFFGKEKTETENTHKVLKLENGKTYSVDFDKEMIFVNRDMAMEMSKRNLPDGDVGEAGKSMLESIGGKIVGTENFLGYTCDVWEMPGGSQLIYKGAMLKADITLLGIRTITSANSARFNHAVSDGYFELPDFPKQQLDSFFDNEPSDGDYEEDDEIDPEALEQLSKMSFGEWKKLAMEEDENEELKNMSDEELRQMFDYIQKMVKMRMGNH